MRVLRDSVRPAIWSRTRAKYTPLEVASKGGHDEIVKILEGA